MKAIREEARDIHVVRDVDVLVVGGGTSGVPAAIAAARLGAKTMLVEKFNGLGGAITWGLTITIPGPLPGAVFKEIMTNLDKRYDGLGIMYSESGKYMIIDQELYKYEAQRLLNEAGVEVLFNTLAVACDTNERKMKALITENKSGRQAICAKVVVDCTGDADVAFRAGAECAMSPVDQLLGITLMCMIANVDLQKSTEGFGGAKTPHEGELNAWAANLEGVDATDAFALSRAEVTLHNEVVERWLKARKDVPAHKRSYIGFCAPHLGVRETRRMVGMKVLNSEEFNSKQLSDGIGTALGNKQVPYGSLVSKDIDGLLVAGRCISAEPDVQHSLRIAPTCALIGEAAGTAAALAVQQDVEPRKLRVDNLQEQLRKQGVPFGPL